VRRYTIRLLVSAAVLFGLALVPALAQAKRVVVLPFAGPRGGQAASQVRRAARVRAVSAGAFLRASREGGRVAAAKKLGVAGIVSGKVGRLRGRWVLRISVRSGHNNRVVGRGTFSLRGTRVDGATARQVGRAVRRHLRRCKKPAGAVRTRRKRRRRRRRRRPIRVRKAPVPAPTPAPAPAPTPTVPKRRGFDDGSDIDGGAGGTGLGDEPKIRPRTARRSGGVGGFGLGEDDERPDDTRRTRVRRRVRDDDDDDDGGGRRRRVRRRGARPAWETVFEVFAGLHVQNRNFSFNDPVSPANPPSYKSGVHTALSINAAIYPLAAFSRGVLADIGLVARYDRVVGLKSQLDATTIADTLSQTFEIGLRYRWNILASATSPVVMVGLEYGRQMFFILSDQPPLPNITYDYLKLALARVQWPFFKRGPWKFGIGGAFDYLLVFSAGDIEQTDSSGYGTSSTGGIGGDVGLFASYKGFALRAQFFYRRFFFDFDRLCAIQGSGCGEAGGALDEYIGGTINLGYLY
jgi:hypothetical protein